MSPRGPLASPLRGSRVITAVHSSLVRTIALQRGASREPDTRRPAKPKRNPVAYLHASAYLSRSAKDTVGAPAAGIRGYSQRAHLASRGVGDLGARSRPLEMGARSRRDHSYFGCTCVLGAYLLTTYHCAQSSIPTFVCANRVTFHSAEITLLLGEPQCTHSFRCRLALQKPRLSKLAAFRRFVFRP